MLHLLQWEFTRALALLIIFAYDGGYTISLGDAWATEGHTEHSCHYQRLAVDLNLFKDGVYLKKTEDHAVLGKYWKEQGGVWGGDFKSSDGNHYSWRVRCPAY